jgi:spore germination protein YaaH
MLKKLSLFVIPILLTTTIFTYVIYSKKIPKSTELIYPLGNAFSVLAASTKYETPEYIVYGYLPYWTLENIEYLQLDKLTDIAYFGIYLKKDGTIKKNLDDGAIEPGYNLWKNSNSLKNLIADCKKNNVRFALTVISHEDEVSDEFLNCEFCWETFADVLENELNSQGVKSVNLNFEYVEYTDEEVANKYTKFVDYITKEMKKRFDSPFVVVSTFADSLVKPRVTKIADLSKVADAMFIMAYDFHRPTSDNAGPVSPVGGAGVHAEYDINTMLDDYLANSPPNKLIMGIPYYGYNWVVEENKEYAKRIEGRDDIGFSQSQSYADIMENLLEVKPEVFWDELGQTPYFTYVSPETTAIREVYFDNKDSLKIKYQLAKENRLLGVGIWALGYDKGYLDLWDLLGEEF